MTQRFFIYALLLIAFSAEARSPSSLLLNAKTGEIVSHHNGHSQRFPASLTKMMTIYLTFEKLSKGEINPEDPVYFTRKACCAEPSKLYLKPKEHISVIDAVLALAVKSANDVAIALAEHLGGSEKAFVHEMNAKAQALGMTHTVFKNASGLPNRKQVSTARDMAILAKALLDHFPEYRHIFSTPYFSFRGKQYKNTNSLLETMEGVDGMKTGYTRAAGWNLVTSYHRGSDHLIGVVMGEFSKNRRDYHMKALLEGRPLSVQEIRRITIKTPDYFHATTTKTRWGIQVGVFRNSKQAKTYAQKIRKNHLELLKNHTYRIIGKISKRVRTFQTRFNCKNEKTARATCTALKKRGIDCFVVSGG
jgi:D-alanyl-D-alanine carboxypeptidase